MKVFLLTITLGGILAAVMFGVLTDWDASAMSIHGWIALTLGTVLSLALGGGLMALVFYSARKGYDDRIEIDAPEATFRPRMPHRNRHHARPRAITYSLVEHIVINITNGYWRSDQTSQNPGKMLTGVARRQSWREPKHHFQLGDGPH